MPEIQHPVGFGTDKSGAVDNIGLAGEDRRQKFWVFCRVIFQVGILNKNDVTLRLGKTRA